MKQLIIAAFAGTVALASMSVFAADDQLQTGPAQGETRTERAKDYVKKKGHNTKVRAKRAGRKAKQVVRDRKATDPASPNESAPAATK